jgi:hypothetical protein
MADEIVLTGRITAGKLKVRGWVPRFELRDGEVLVTIRRASATRSRLANALYWAGFVKPLSEYTGYSPNQVHAYLKQRFLPKQRIEIVDKHTGVVVDEQDLAQLTTTTLTHNEFSDFLHDVREFAETLNVRVGSREDAA